ncbi:hypothetical protein PFICI_14759 [Pestalotiopsis fici W106-1]|uniref:Uncharacterized protein n=1 Tax=Pestalotiopsis fici (strain W106-1 / CGMCC3.15140) TaxID=1229662 RepID=W3WIW2_PESFW|nr:uncharacterized protein PFICI_14759 [Pestalotiopsis fici W106-1]ETS73813.1 hypothetical protein PFICI_14759 [Pestalotiopsis fici W106-1]
MSTPTAPLAPLTTIFTPPCSISWLLTTTKVPSQFPPFPTNGPSSCDPPSWVANLKDKGFQYYSPAICPSGFEVGPSCEITKTRTAEGFPPVVNGETAVYCVPSGHTCTTDTTDFRGGVWGFTREAATPASGSVIVTAGPALQIRFREEDLSILETHPLTPGLVLAGATTDSTAVTAAQTTSTSTSASTSTSIASFSTITIRPSAVSREETSSLDTTEDGTSSNSVFSSAGSSGAGSVSFVTTTEATTTTAQASGSESSGSLNPGSVAAITLSSILIVIVLVISSVIFMRRSRRKRHDNAALLQPYRYKPWSSGAGGLSNNPRASTSSLDSIVLPLQSAAELPGTAPVIPELALSTRLGAKENPAELGAEELAAELSGNARAPSTTWSWMSRASKRGSARSQKTRSSIAPSSFTRWTRSAASMQTASSGRYSGDWESFARGKWPNGLTVPAVPMDRPLPDVPKTPRSAKLHIASYLKPDAGRDRWSRESAGTFGAPGKSPVSTIFTNKP